MGSVTIKGLEMETSSGPVCSVCGGSQFREESVLWQALVEEWQLSRAERAYVDRQQGCTCLGCGASLRLSALARAICFATGASQPLKQAVASGLLDGLRILDCNGAGTVSDTLKDLPHYCRADYPECDLQRLSFPDASFDLVLHSDTLEHVEHPVLALEECRRVLTPDGRLCFTVPVIHGRMTRNRAGLPASYHGNPGDLRGDFRVHTEYGADVWTQVFDAGFTNVAMTQVDFPSALAMTAWNDERITRPHPQNEAQPECDEAPPSSTPSSPPQEAVQPPPPFATYDQDGLRSHHNHEFMHDPGFQQAYARGIQAVGIDYNWHWRVHVGLWAASMALKVPGDFAEFGVNRGFMSSAIMRYLDWNKTRRRFYLLDTFSGIDERYLNDDDRAIGVVDRNRRDIETGFYTFDIDAVRDNFSEWPQARVIAGVVPETLPQIDSHCIAFAHIDMNCAPPEVAAAEFVWPRMPPGGIILLDDYAYAGYRSQKLAMDTFARGKCISILSLPTGQGLMIRPDQ
jgi:SAM-dependent methyltransferase